MQQTVRCNIRVNGCLIKTEPHQAACKVTLSVDSCNKQSNVGTGGSLIQRDRTASDAVYGVDQADLITCIEWNSPACPPNIFWRWGECEGLSLPWVMLNGIVYWNGIQQEHGRTSNLRVEGRCHE